ncbi:hypothetical protein EST38_g5478 [Candolleomyces aberdarensis]|uniref:Asp/Glu/hydantoin racemase n=1 Tax=Candolleomyces aberdarensis TaxID=2316362 RepID=A0A4Q2DKA3_9AGAR|nr:hypothetical protein EST38_g5478 [Candolleomyces aberdarensis]
MADQEQAKLLIINPNTTQSMTQGLRDALIPLTPPGTHLTFYTAPAELGASPAISDISTGIQSAQACAKDIIYEKKLLDVYDGFLVCCFSDHPLTHALREHTKKPVVGILESSIVHALFVGHRFGIITTGTGYGYIYHKDVKNFLGATSDRFAGLLTTGVGVVELREGDKETVERKIKETSVKMVGEKGADVILLGCAGMAGMEELVKGAVRDAKLGDVKVVDGAKAGVEFLAGLARLDKASQKKQ